MRTVHLNDGALIPWLGYGSGTAHYGKDVASITLTALQAGFTHLDGAQAYANESSSGSAIAQFLKSQDKVERKQLFVTTKLGPVPEGGSVESKLRDSLKKFGLDYVDLFLIHNPKEHEAKGLTSVWKEMIAVKKLGLTKSIGVSNFNKAQIKELLDAGLEAPVVNQIEYHAFLVHTLQPLLDFQAQHNIITQSYAGLTPLIASRFEKVSDPAIKEKREKLEKLMEAIAKKYNMSTSQAILKWLKARGFVAITTSTQEARIKEYLATDELPDLDAEEVEQITKAAGNLKLRGFETLSHMDDQQ